MNPFIIAAGAAAAYLYQKNKSDSFTGSQPLTERQKAVINFINALATVVKANHYSGQPYGDFSYVRTNQQYQRTGQRWKFIYQGHEIKDPLSQETIYTGNYTDLQHFTLWYMQQYNMPNIYGYNTLTLQDQQQLIDAFWNADNGMKKAMGTEAPNGATWISGIINSIDLSKAAVFISDVILAAGAITATIATGGAAAPADIALISKISKDFK